MADYTFAILYPLAMTFTSKFTVRFVADLVNSHVLIPPVLSCCCPLRLQLQRRDELSRMSHLTGGTGSLERSRASMKSNLISSGEGSTGSGKGGQGGQGGSEGQGQPGFSSAAFDEDDDVGADRDDLVAATHKDKQLASERASTQYLVNSGTATAVTTPKGLNKLVSLLARFSLCTVEAHVPWCACSLVPLRTVRRTARRTARSAAPLPRRPLRPR